MLEGKQNTAPTVLGLTDYQGNVLEVSVPYTAMKMARTYHGVDYLRGESEKESDQVKS